MALEVSGQETHKRYKIMRHFPVGFAVPECWCVRASSAAVRLCSAVWSLRMKPRTDTGSAISSEEVNFLVFRYLQESGEEKGSLL